MNVSVPRRRITLLNLLSKYCETEHYVYSRTAGRNGVIDVARSAKRPLGKQNGLVYCA